MKRLLLACFCIATYGPTPCQTQSSQATSERLFSLTLSALTPSVEAGKRIELKIVMKNLTDHNLAYQYGIRDYQDRSNDYEVWDASGKKLEPSRKKYPQIGDTFEPTLPHIVKPGETETSGIAITLLYDMTQPGTYTIQASRRISDEPNDGVVRSNKITITVTQPSGRLADLPSLNEASATPKEQKEEINYARNLDVHQLDSTLPSMRLEDWLRSGPAGIEKVSWRSSPTCDLKDPEPLPTDKNDWATCVKFVFAYRGLSDSSAYVEGMITVGTVRKGITGPPRFEYFAFMDNDFFQRNASWVPDYNDKKLSDLFRALADISTH